MKELQSRVRRFCRENGLESPAEIRVLDALSELGEVAKEIIRMSDYGRRPLTYREQLKSELGDLLFSVITVANSFDVDLEEALGMALGKYGKRLGKGGSAGSEND
jgi:NTP pyrophosphatase (non-canonical NTP hydrolase)